MFYDEVHFPAIAGNGGNGACSFRREKFVPNGGPDGGSGGEGGSVIIQATRDFNTLSHLQHVAKIEAAPGQRGGKQNRHGKEGEHAVVMVPLGTVVYKQFLDEYHAVADLMKEGEQYVVAQGGKGGMGNALLATPNYQVPNFAQLGDTGERAEIRLELKIIADVGLIGYPNVGKSTLISVISNAKPKIANYAFTTLTPNLGVVKREIHDFVVADIPGLIEGAHLGKGLGDTFLRHIERTRVLVHLIDLYEMMLFSKFDLDLCRSRILESYNAINNELRQFDEAIMKKPQIIVLNKIDLVDPEFLQMLQADTKLISSLTKFSGQAPFFISSATHTNLDSLLDTISHALQKIKKDVDSKEIVKIFRPIMEAEEMVEITHTSDGYHVRGKKAEAIVNTTDLKNDEALRWMHDRLERLGVNEKLIRAGVQTGDLVTVGTYEFDWE